MILNPAMECMDRESMTKLQSERLVATVKRCYENVPFYRKKMDKMGIKPEDIKGVQMKIDFGSAIRSYVFMPYTLAKDTRTGYENGNINAVMDGDIDGFINAYLSMKA